MLWIYDLIQATQQACELGTIFNPHFIGEEMGEREMLDSLPKVLPLTDDETGIHTPWRSGPGLALNARTPVNPYDETVTVV